MIKISEILDEIIKNNPLFVFGIKNNILNLSALAKFIHKTVEQRAKKEVSEQSLIMQLSRIQRNFSDENIKNIKFSVNNISIILGLCTISFDKSIDLQKKILDIKMQIGEKGGFFSFGETSSEITIIFEKRFLNYFESYEKSQIYEQKDLSGVKLKFSQEYFNTPGLISFLLDKFTLSNINIVEISSSFTEIIFYISEKDTKKAFDILYN